MGRISDRLKRADAFLARNTFSTALIIRLLPIGSNFITNIAAGLSSVKPPPFFLGSALGYIPQMLIFALLGSGINIETELRIGVSIALFLVSGILGAYLYRRYRRERGTEIESP